MIQCECKKSTASNSCQQQTAQVCRNSHKRGNSCVLVHMQQLQAVLPLNLFLPGLERLSASAHPQEV